MLYPIRLPIDVCPTDLGICVPRPSDHFLLNDFHYGMVVLERWALMSDSFPIAKGKSGIPVYHCLVSLVLGNPQIPTCYWE